MPSKNEELFLKNTWNFCGKEAHHNHINIHQQNTFICSYAPLTVQLKAPFHLFWSSMNVGISGVKWNFI